MMALKTGLLEDRTASAHKEYGSVSTMGRGV